jgi:uncharacterized protein
MEELRRFFDLHLPKVLQTMREELDVHLFFHDIRHTLDVLEQAVAIGAREEVSPEELCLLKVAALYHDIGYIKGRKNHEDSSVKLFLQGANQFGLNDEHKSRIVSCIRSTNFFLKPEGQLEKIMADANLDYLGREDFIQIENTIYLEYLSDGDVTCRLEWYDRLLKYMQSHQFNTASSIIKRADKKMENLAYVKAMVKKYSLEAKGDKAA